jgi:hypothetical protein
MGQGMDNLNLGTPGNYVYAFPVTLVCGVLLAGRCLSQQRTHQSPHRIFDLSPKNRPHIRSSRSPINYSVACLVNRVLRNRLGISHCHITPTEGSEKPWEKVSRSQLKGLEVEVSVHQLRRYQSKERRRKHSGLKATV